ncbi:DUF1295 domain-containing protein [Candidatus Izemoplasma sp. B36]|uniref:DUF1295 domain-containing protein n=1 Tax=Candidatus Izemoplasma sp. B36 TaxID=3242468 RepID=UPI003556331C
MNLNSLNKKQSGLIFLIVYGFSMLLGAVVAFLGSRYTSNPILTILIADVMMTLVVFIIGSIIRNASLYDPYWSVIPLFFLIIYTISFNGFMLPSNSIFMIIVVGLWSIRLTYNWWKNWTGFAEQDWRYDMLKEKSPKLYPITNLFGIHLIPTIVVFLQMINMVEVIRYSTTNFIFYIGVFIALLSPIFQHFADKQMYEFRQNNKSKEKVINVGLWRFTRHPNYFGEIILWVGIYVMYFSYVKVIDINIIYPISMILLFVFISIPMMENKLIDRPGYKEYKKQVSMLIPFFPKKIEESSEVIEEKA